MGRLSTARIAASKTLARMIDAGVTPDMSLDLVVALRASNFAAVLMAIVSIGGIVMAVANDGTAWLALAVGVCIMAYICALLLAGLGLPDAARFAFLTVCCVHWTILSVALGPHSGIRFGLLGLIVYPLICFARRESLETVLAYVLIFVSFVVAQVLTHRFGPLVPFSPAALERGDYFILTALAFLCGLGILYYQRSAASARLSLDEAHRRIAELLANVLPAAIAARLEQQHGTIADSHGEATVLFADLTDFSALTRRLSPAHLVELLDMIFSRCDEAAARHGVEKIKTIGDCYMAATGVLTQSDGAAAVEDMADFGLEMLQIVARAAEETGLALGLRVGISTGSVISGVIGRRKYTFDVWGDTVNLAERMQSAGVSGRIQVSEATYWRLRHAFEFETERVVALKGKDRAPAYLLIARRDGARATL
jgi:adenylate cyclase